MNDNTPTISTRSFSVDENTTAVGTISASDPDGDTLTYSIGGTDASSFNLDTSTGALSFKVAPDYETKTLYAITATVDDGTTNRSRHHNKHK